MEKQLDSISGELKKPTDGQGKLRDQLRRMMHALTSEIRSLGTDLDDLGGRVDNMGKSLAQEIAQQFTTAAWKGGIRDNVTQELEHQVLILESMEDKKFPETSVGKLDARLHKMALQAHRHAQIQCAQNAQQLESGMGNGSSVFSELLAVLDPKKELAAVTVEVKIDRLGEALTDRMSKMQKSIERMNTQMKQNTEDLSTQAKVSEANFDRKLDGLNTRIKTHMEQLNDSVKEASKATVQLKTSQRHEMAGLRKQLQLDGLKKSLEAQMVGLQELMAEAASTLAKVNPTNSHEHSKTRVALTKLVETKLDGLEKIAEAADALVKLKGTTELEVCTFVRDARNWN